MNDVEQQLAGWFLTGRKESDDDGDIVFAGDLTADELKALLETIFDGVFAQVTAQLKELTESIHASIAARAPEARLTSTSTVKSQGIGGADTIRNVPGAPAPKERLTFKSQGATFKG